MVSLDRWVVTGVYVEECCNRKKETLRILSMSYNLLGLGLSPFLDFVSSASFSLVLLIPVSVVVVGLSVL